MKTYKKLSYYAMHGSVDEDKLDVINLFLMTEKYGKSNNCIAKDRVRILGSGLVNFVGKRKVRFVTDQMNILYADGVM